MPYGQVNRQEAHSWNSHVGPQANVFLCVSQEASRRPQSRSIAFKKGTCCHSRHFALVPLLAVMYRLVHNHRHDCFPRGCALTNFRVTYPVPRLVLFCFHTHRVGMCHAKWVLLFVLPWCLCGASPHVHLTANATDDAYGWKRATRFVMQCTLQVHDAFPWVSMRVIIHKMHATCIQRITCKYAGFHLEESMLHSTFLFMGVARTVINQTHVLRVPVGIGSGASIHHLTSIQ